mmetsp:Transcript_53613/g.149150  ORF Transcript_53613/g.149150 Transcript_53613/m.149150 type:complete len:245 (+) Transcript_53613:161-895(+)
MVSGQQLTKIRPRKVREAAVCRRRGKAVAAFTWRLKSFRRCPGDAYPSLFWGRLRSPPPLSEKRLHKEVGRSWPVRCVLPQQSLSDIAQLLRETATMPNRPIWLALHHRARKLQQRPGREWKPQSTELVAYASEGPHVDVVVVTFVPHELWGHVCRRAYAGGCEGCAFKHARNAEIADSDATPALAQEYVGTLQVPVHNAQAVQVLQTGQGLSNPRHDDGLRERTGPRMQAFGDDAPEIPAVGE